MMKSTVAVGFFLCLIAVTIFTCYWFCTILHELGHGLVAYIFTFQPPDVFVGSMGEKSNCIRLRLGFANLYVDKNPIKWFHGVCWPKRAFKFKWQEMIFVVAGPVLPVFLSFTFLIHFLENESGWGIFITVILCSVTVLSAMYNLRASPYSIELVGGSFTVNDGTQARRNISRSWLNLYDQYVLAHQEENYRQAAQTLETLYRHRHGRDKELIEAINLYVILKDYAAVARLVDEHCPWPLQADLATNIAYAYSETNQIEKAIEFNQKALALDPSNVYALNNLGYAQMCVGKWDEARLCFVAGLKLVPNSFAYLHSNLGLVRGVAGDLEGAEECFAKALEIDGHDLDYVLLFKGISFWTAGNLNHSEKIFQSLKAQVSRDKAMPELNLWLQWFEHKSKGLPEPVLVQPWLVFSLWGLDVEPIVETHNLGEYDAV